MLFTPILFIGLILKKKLMTGMARAPTNENRGLYSMGVAGLMHSNEIVAPILCRRDENEKQNLAMGK